MFKNYCQIALLKGKIRCNSKQVLHVFLIFCHFCTPEHLPILGKKIKSGSCPDKLRQLGSKAI